MCRYVYESDKYGNLIKEAYFDENFNRTYSKEFISGKRATIDKNGNITRVDYLNQEDKPFSDIYGINHIINRYDSKGRHTQFAYRTLSGVLAVGKEGYAMAQLKYYKNTIFPVYITYFGSDGKLTRNNISGVAAIERWLDSKGNIRGMQFFGENSTRISDIKNVSKLEMQYDDNNRIVREKYYDPKDKFILNSDGAYGREYDYDQKGNLVAMRFIDEKNNPMVSKVYEVSETRFGYDKKGNIIERSYFLPGNVKAVYKPSGIHKEIFEHNDKGKTTRSYYLDTNDSLSKNSGGFAIIGYEYDEGGNLANVKYYDEFEHLADNDKGIAIERGVYNKFKEFLDYSTSNKKEELVENEMGVAGMHGEYDEAGKQTLYLQFDKNRLLRNNDAGVAKFISKFNDFGELTEIAYYGQENQPTQWANTNVFKTVHGYDSLGREIITKFYGTDNNPIVNSATGFALHKIYYDDKGNIIKREAFDENSLPRVCNYGYAVWKGKYDKDNILVKGYFYDENGKEIAFKDKKAWENTPDHEGEYSKYYFNYSTSDIVFGFAALAAALGFFIAVIISFKKRKWSIVALQSAIFIILLGVSFILIDDFLLHYSIIMPKVYNYSWIILIGGVGGCLVCVAITIKAMALPHYALLKTYWRINRYSYKKNLYKRLYQGNREDVWDTLLILVIVAGLCLFIYLFISEISLILTNPL